jgi:tRNA pseudouridine38-40 synthase
VEYDGTDFCGFQFQPHMRTVAGELEATLSRLFDEPVKIAAAGRTDAGVHAVGQVISFATERDFPTERLALAANSLLPLDVSLREAARVPAGFSARLHALERRYTYVILNRTQPLATLRRFSHHEHRELDLARMRHAARDFEGTHDFISFCGVMPNDGNTVRTVRAVEIESEPPLLRLHFAAKGFLHRMVRVMTGTLLEIAVGRRPADAVPALLAARDRTVAGPTVPPQGLFLVGVAYADFDSNPGNLLPIGRIGSQRQSSEGT